MKRFFIIVIVLSILISCFVFSTSAASYSSPFSIDTDFYIARLINPEAGTWSYIYHINETYLSGDNGYYFASPMFENYVVDYYSFFHAEFEVYRTDGRPLALAGDDVMFFLSDILVEHWFSHNDTYYTWNQAHCSTELIVEFTDGSLESVYTVVPTFNNDAGTVSLTGLTHKDFNKDIKSVTFTLQYWPSNTNGIKWHDTIVQLSWFKHKVPTVDLKDRLTLVPYDPYSSDPDDTEEPSDPDIGGDPPVDPTDPDTGGDTGGGDPPVDPSDPDTGDGTGGTDFDDITGYDPDISTPSGGDVVGGLGSAEQGLIGSVSGGLDGIGDQVKSALSVLTKYASGLFAVSWILSLFYELSFLKDLLIFSLALSVIVILFNISLLASNRHGRDARRSSGKKKGG